MNSRRKIGIGELGLEGFITLAWFGTYNNSEGGIINNDDVLHGLMSADIHEVYVFNIHTLLSFLVVPLTGLVAASSCSGPWVSSLSEIP